MNCFRNIIDACYKNFSNKKVVFAKEMAEFITAENSRSVLDLKLQIEKLYKFENHSCTSILDNSGYGNSMLNLSGTRKIASHFAAHGGLCQAKPGTLCSATGSWLFFCCISEGGVLIFL